MTDKEIKSFATSFRKGILNGQSPISMCYAVCAPLSCLLYLEGVKNELVKYDIDNKNAVVDFNCEVIEHWVIKIGNKILDPTASQFKGMPKVFFGARPIYYTDSI